MAMLEDSYSTWFKRFMQTHYSYSDYHEAATVPIPTTLQLLQLYLQSLGASLNQSTSFYTFGINARAMLNPFGTPALGVVTGVVNWPANCYARRVTVRCTEDAWAAIISLNPEYLKQRVIQGATNVVPTAQALIVEVEKWIGELDAITFEPTYGYAILFRANAIPGVMRIYIEANVEGTE